VGQPSLRVIGPRRKATGRVRGAGSCARLAVGCDLEISRGIGGRGSAVGQGLVRCGERGRARALPAGANAARRVAGGVLAGGGELADRLVALILQLAGEGWQLVSAVLAVPTRPLARARPARRLNNAGYALGVGDT
jgi:hypothetical protein